MSERFHLTPDGPRPCRVDPFNERSRGCKYGDSAHFSDLEGAESSYADQMGGVVPDSIVSKIVEIADTTDIPVGPPVPERFYHVARKSDLDSILQKGLLPSIGDRSESLGEDAPRVYLFDSRISAEDGLGNWLADEFHEDEEFVLISVNPAKVGSPTATYIYEDEECEGGYGPSTEWTSDSPISGSEITVEGEI